MLIGHCLKDYHRCIYDGVFILGQLVKAVGHDLVQSRSAGQAVLPLSWQTRHCQTSALPFELFKT